MKKWHVEQILYLNELSKTKLALPQVYNFARQSRHVAIVEKENAIITFLRKLLAFFVDAL